MRDDGQERETERGGLKVHTTRTARFAALVAAAGKPEVYLPLSDPKQDRSFMKAVKEHRVLSIRQEPTSKRTDYGAVGFDDRKHTSYLVFPKSLNAFVDARVVGIKYDVIGGSPMVASGPLKAPARKILPPSHRTQASKRPAHAAIQKPQPSRPAKPQPKEFRVHLRITKVIEKDVTVKAMTKAEARKQAETEVADEGAARAVSVREV